MALNRFATQTRFLPARLATYRPSSAFASKSASEWVEDVTAAQPKLAVT